MIAILSTLSWITHGPFTFRSSAMMIIRSKFSKRCVKANMTIRSQRVMRMKRRPRALSFQLKLLQPTITKKTKRRRKRRRKRRMLVLTR